MIPPESQTNQPDIDRAIYKHALLKLSLWKRISSATDQVQGAVARKFTYSGRLGFVMSAHEFGRGKLSEEYTVSLLPKYTSETKMSGGIIQLRRRHLWRCDKIRVSKESLASTIFVFWSKIEFTHVIFSGFIFNTKNRSCFLRFSARLGAFCLSTSYFSAI